MLNIVNNEWYGQKCFEISAVVVSITAFWSIIYNKLCFMILCQYTIMIKAK